MATHAPPPPPPHGTADCPCAPSAGACACAAPASPAAAAAAATAAAAGSSWALPWAAAGSGSGSALPWVVEAAAGSTLALVLVLLCGLGFWCYMRRRRGYAGLRAEAGTPLRVCFELADGLREDGELSLGGLRSVKQLRVRLLQLADELLLDPEDDLGEWTLRYTDHGGVLLPVAPSVSIACLRRQAQELRVTAGKALHAEPHRLERAAARR